MKLSEAIESLRRVREKNGVTALAADDVLATYDAEAPVREAEADLLAVCLAIGDPARIHRAALRVHELRKPTPRYTVIWDAPTGRHYVGDMVTGKEVAAVTLAAMMNEREAK